MILDPPTGEQSEPSRPNVIGNRGRSFQVIAIALGVTLGACKRSEPIASLPEADAPAAARSPAEAPSADSATTAATAVNVVIRRAVLTRTNGSLPPRARKVRRWELEATASEEITKLFQEVATNTRVNGVVSLAEYATMLSNDDRAALARVHERSPTIDRRTLPSGADTRVLLLTGDGISLSISSDNDIVFAGPGLVRLYAVIEAEGTYTEVPAGAKPTPKAAPR